MIDTERLTTTSNKGGVAFTFDLDITCKPSEAQKILRLAEKLKSYEDAEEQGLLFRLPCKVGGTVWAITAPINVGFKEGENPSIYECVVGSITFYKNGMHQLRLYHDEVFVAWYVRFSDFGKKVFLTKAEAEAALGKMKGE